MIALVLIIIAFIVFSGFLAMIDAAILSVTPGEVEELIFERKWGARPLKRITRNLTRTISVVVIFTNIVNVLGPILVGQKAIELFGSSVIGVITAVLTFATIVFSEIIPKALGAHYAPTISRIAAPLLYVLGILLFPLVVLLEKLVRVFQSGKREIGTEEQIRALANIGGGEGLIDSDERELIHRAFVLNDRRTRDSMTSVAGVIAIPAAASVLESAKYVFDHSYSRYPVYEKNIHDIKGFILSRDILAALANGNRDHSITALIRPIQAVRADMRVDDLLNYMRRKKAQIALVQENGATVGIVTLEDVLEELVGDIEDEGDARG